MFKKAHIARVPYLTQLDAQDNDSMLNAHIMHPMSIVGRLRPNLAVE